ncbi:hypothetical protein CO174_05080 [Candidatus Uhrbacteria bacterium CG_4_9_14_3_um_filter_50_9]|uniref:N-acetyltransferase domain-containing protein n=1 Tax=Candidatus Uhrbacteria bacterium CG_4_9_14_3_um_filter_50_9 TaxID=1975035 RepID=A0A2M7XB30_9BACT|nr:MAG: hypothetical protein CO174_05080 [Candidatus Uhrbacteria bacterium CG_4_9_14_3_um_filter_50_9]
MYENEWGNWSHEPTAIKHQVHYGFELTRLEELVEVTAAALHRSVDQVLIDDVAAHEREAESVLTMRHDGKLIGFMLLTFPLMDTVYIAGTMIIPSFQGCGLKRMATAGLMYEVPGMRFFAGRTQSSIVWASVAGSASQVLPNPDGGRVDQELIDTRAALVQVLNMDGVIHKGFYGGPLYGEKPMHRDGNVQAWWDTFCDFERGDAVLYVARM